jgi:hypothetical protein
VSLSWLDRHTLLVHPRRIVLERKPWRGPAQRFTAEVQPAQPGEADWQPALTATSTLLAAQSHAYGRLRIVVANQFVRFALLPWSDSVLGVKARLGMAKALLRNSLGEQAEQLDIALDCASFGLNGLAAGIPRSLLAALRQMAKSRRLRLDSLQPRLTADLASCRLSLSDGCVVFPDDGWLTLIGLRDNNISLLRNHRTHAEPEQLSNELSGLLAAENATVNRKKVRIFSSHTWPKMLGDWEIEQKMSILEGGAHA